MIENPDRLADVQTMMQFMDQHTDCFERTCIPGHFTGSAWLMNREGTQVLLMHHRKLNIWLQTGGHCDGDSDVLAVALREAREESGIQQIVPVSEKIFDIDICPVPAIGEDPAHDHYDIRFLLQVQSDERAIKNNESNAIQWFGRDPAEWSTKDKSVLQTFRKWATL
jgi:8-oxo-dGTP pyrophosphatase MutT (NUDIX family)